MLRWALVAAALLTGSVGAATLETYGDRVIAIRGLDLVSGRYDVTFDYTTYTEAPVGAFLFLGDQPGAVAAATAINAMLNSVEAREVGPAPVFGGFRTPNGFFYTVPFGPDPNSPPGWLLTVLSVAGGDPWRLNVDGPTGRSSDFRDHIAVFAPVPIPAAAWLFASALGGLTWMRRRPARQPA